jgi:hypothetical protein
MYTKLHVIGVENFTREEEDTIRDYLYGSKKGKQNLEIEFNHFLETVDHCESIQKMYIEAASKKGESVSVVFICKATNKLYQQIKKSPSLRIFKSFEYIVSKTKKVEKSQVKPTFSDFSETKPIFTEHQNKRQVRPNAVYRSCSFSFRNAS